jgi:hypothetical protein
MAMEALRVAITGDGELTEQPDVLALAVQKATAILVSFWTIVAKGADTTADPRSLTWYGVPLDPKIAEALTAAMIRLLDGLFEASEE